MEREGEEQESFWVGMVGGGMREGMVAGSIGMRQDPNSVPSPLSTLLFSFDLRQQNGWHRTKEIHWDSRGMIQCISKAALAGGGSLVRIGLQMKNDCILSPRSEFLYSQQVII